MAEHFVLRFWISEHVRLSTALWLDGNIWRGSAILQRKRGRRWVNDPWWEEISTREHPRVAGEPLEAREEDCSWRLTNEAAVPLIEKELGEVPLRFFRDNAL